MHSTKEVTNITLYKNGSPKLEIIKEFPILELIANGNRVETFRAYTNPNGVDISSLKASVINKEGCNIIPDAPIISFKYDVTNKVAILRLDKSKISPLKNKGYIQIKVSGNYKFCQLVMVSWNIHKEVPQISNDWIMIDKGKEPIVWRTGKVVVSKVSLLLPSEIKENSIWYQMPSSLSIAFSGDDSEKFSIEPKSSGLSFNEKYNVYYNCQGTIGTQITKDINLILCANNNEEKGQKKMSVKFCPAKCFVQPELTFCTSDYELGSQNTLLAILKLCNKCENKAAIAKVKVDIKCNDKIVECDKSEIEVMTTSPKTVNIKMIRENLIKLPIQDVIVEVDVTSCNEYTEVHDFSGTFKLTI